MRLALKARTSIAPSNAWATPMKTTRINRCLRRRCPSLGSRQKMIPQDCAGFGFVYKAPPLVHIRISADGGNEVDGL